MMSETDRGRALREAVALEMRRATEVTPRPTPEALEQLARGTLSVDDERSVRRAVMLHAGAWAEYEAARARCGLQRVPVDAEGDAEDYAPHVEPPDDELDDELAEVVLPFTRLSWLTDRREPGVQRLAAAGPEGGAPPAESFQHERWSVLVFEDGDRLRARVERAGEPVRGARVAVRESGEESSTGPLRFSRSAVTDAAGEVELGALATIPPPRIGGGYLLVLSVPRARD